MESFSLHYFFSSSSSIVRSWLFLCWECGVSAEPQVVRPVTIGHFAHWPHTKSDAVHKFKQRDGTKAFKLYSSLFVQLGFFFPFHFCCCICVCVQSWFSVCFLAFSSHSSDSFWIRSLLIGQHSATGPAVFHVVLFFFPSTHTLQLVSPPPPLSLTESVLSTVCWAVHSMSTGHRSSVHHFPKGPFFLSLGCQWIGCFISFLFIFFYFIFFSSVWIFFECLH